MKIQEQGTKWEVLSWFSPLGVRKNTPNNTQSGLIPLCHKKLQRSVTQMLWNQKKNADCKESHPVVLNIMMISLHTNGTKACV